jgi:hypothetical protein
MLDLDQKLLIRSDTNRLQYTSAFPFNIDFLFFNICGRIWHKLTCVIKNMFLKGQKVVVFFKPMVDDIKTGIWGMEIQQTKVEAIRRRPQSVRLECFNSVCSSMQREVSCNNTITSGSCLQCLK